MYTLIIGTLTGAAAGLASYFGGHLPGVWSCVIGITAALIVQMAITLLLRSRINKINASVQQILTDTQMKLQVKQGMYMRRPANPKVMLSELEREQHGGLRKALAALDQFKSLQGWNFLITKQVNTMRMMFLYQLKEFDQVDVLLPKCLFFDPQSISMKLARMYVKEAPAAEIDKFFKKKIKSLKNENVVLPYSVYTWILLKQQRDDEAFKTMTDAKSKTTDETIHRNWENLANGKFRHFSNSGIGDAWYMLGLEMPKMPKMQQQQVRYR